MRVFLYDWLTYILGLTEGHVCTKKMNFIKKLIAIICIQVYLYA